MCCMRKIYLVEEQRRWSLFLSGTDLKLELLDADLWDPNCRQSGRAAKGRDRVNWPTTPLGRVYSAFSTSPHFWEPQLHPQGHQVSLQVCPGTLMPAHCGNQNGCLSLISQLAFLQWVCGLTLRPSSTVGWRNRERQSRGTQEWSRCWSWSHLWPFSVCTWEKHLVSLW